MKYADRSIYKGHYINNMKNGQGFLKFPNGNIYDGDFKNDFI